ncbi:BTAD domain-containing putative transcriptional regulator [Nocardia sp. NPDC004068]|uniref:BTAD domain-containing putative transcriptional regulator n=1 Tax=Nocardia sp. NPDC004068 TaxID=3364303 RepID=UPI0036AACD65
MTSSAGVGPLVLAVAGVGPRAGVTTTAVAVAQSWPGPEPALVVEADLAGGQLADLNGGDPYLGVASLARAVAATGPVTGEQLVEHVQILAGGVAVLAAPPGRDRARAAVTESLLVHRRWPGLEATVIADCGAPEPDSPLAPVLAAADACLVVVRADHTDPLHAAQRILRLTEHSRRRGVLVIGASPHSDFAAALALPLLGTLPHAPGCAEALLHGTRPPRRQRLLPAARTIATAVRHQLHPPAPDTVTHPPVRRASTGRRPAAGPRVYRLDSAPIPSTSPPPDSTDDHVDTVLPVPAPAPVDDRGEPPRADRTGRDIAASADALLGRDLDTAPTDTVPVHSESAAVTEVSPTVEPVVAISVFGPVRVVWRAAGAGEVEITGRLQPRSREILAALVLHPDGVSRPRLIDVLWGEHPPARASGALTNALSRLRTAVAASTRGQATDLLTDDRLRYRLSESLVAADYWEFTAAVAARRRARGDDEQATACRRIIDLATAELASDLTGIWIEPIREAARREYLNAVGWLAAHTVEIDPRATLGLLETAVETDPYNEPVWHDILRLHARLGEHAALTRTYSLLTRKLAEIGETPSPETRRLLEHLRHTTPTTPMNESSRIRPPGKGKTPEG